MNRIVLLFLFLTLNSCASMPLSTIVRMSTFDGQDFVKLKAEELRVKVMLPEGFALNGDESWLGIDIKSSTGVYQGKFELKQEFEETIQLNGGLFDEPEQVTAFTLGLSESSTVEFNELQQFISSASAEDIHIRVVPKLESFPVDAVTVKVWIDLLLSQSQGYLTLVDAAKLPLDKLRAM